MNSYIINDFVYKMLMRIVVFMSNIINHTDYETYKNIKEVPMDLDQILRKDNY